MEEVIKKIIQIEEEAAEIEKAASEEIRQKKIEQEETLNHLQQTLKRKAAAKVDTLHEWEMKEVDEEIKRRKVAFQQQLAAMDKMEKEKSKIWLDALFAEITKE